MEEASKVRRIIRILLAGFIVGLILSGLTAFPLQWELNTLARLLGSTSLTPDGLMHWMLKVCDGLNATYTAYPFIAYGTDWLAFGHIVIALAFIGVWRDPVRNIWIIEWGMLACILVIPLALICGPIRGIPFYWQLIDCSFGIVGIIPLWLCRRFIMRLETLISGA